MYIAVKFDSTNKTYTFKVSDFEVKSGDRVVVETARGLEIGKVTVSPFEKPDINLEIKGILRLATKRDLQDYEENKEDAARAKDIAQKEADRLNLGMNIIASEYTLDRAKITFTYLADDRVDFRELAKKLAQKYKTRIELRQIGVRDKAKRVGGLGPCGLFLCCNSFLTDFSSVSINMAKNQFLALNPSKINGVCGRLLCCLGYENDVYTELKKDFPKLGSIIETEYGIGKIVEIDVFKRTYSVDLKEKGIVEFELEGIYGKNK